MPHFMTITQGGETMKAWLIALTFLASFAVATDAEAHWWPRHRVAYYGYSTYYVAPAPVVYVPPPVVAYRPVVVAPVAVAPVYVAPPVVAYRPAVYPIYPVTYSAYYPYSY